MTSWKWRKSSLEPIERSSQSLLRNRFHTILCCAGLGDTWIDNGAAGGGKEVSCRTYVNKDTSIVVTSCLFMLMWKLTILIGNSNLEWVKAWTGKAKASNIIDDPTSKHLEANLTKCQLDNQAEKSDDQKSKLRRSSSPTKHEKSAEDSYCQYSPRAGQFFLRDLVWNLR